MIRSIAIDDEPLALEVVKLHCEKVPGLKLERTFLSAVDALEYLKENRVDLIFLDINMPEINGLGFRQFIVSDIQIIFITAYEDYAVKSYELNATDYILKPVSFERFYNAIEKVKQRQVGLNENQLSKVSKAETIVVRGDKKVYQIKITEIEYIEGQKDYAKIYLTNQERVVIRESLKRIASSLAEHNFVRVHRSYIVPIQKIVSIYGNTIRVGSREVPLGKVQRNVLLDKFKQGGILGDRSA